MLFYSTSATYYSLTTIFRTKWLVCISWINQEQASGMDFTLVEYCTKWVHIMGGPGVAFILSIESI